MVRFLHRFMLIAAVPLALSLASVPAYAESYLALQSKGFKTSKLGRNKAGLLGWTVSDGKTRYFCEWNTAITVVDSKTLMAISSSGRPITLNRAVYENQVGGPDPSMAMYSDIKAGRLKGNEVRSCRKLR